MDIIRLRFFTMQLSHNRELYKLYYLRYLDGSLLKKKEEIRMICLMKKKTEYSRSTTK